MRVILDKYGLRVFAAIGICLGLPAAQAAKVADVKVVDHEYIMVRVLDGQVELVEKRSEIKRPYGSVEFNSALDVVTRFDPALDIAASQEVANWRVCSLDDTYYGAAGKSVVAIHRKTKLNGMAVRAWDNAQSDYRYETPFEHRVFLKLPSPMKQGSRYTIKVDEAVHLDERQLRLTFDIFTSRSEALHINLAGYAAAPGIKAADLYEWMGDGGARDYQSFEGNAVYLYEVKSSKKGRVGEVTFWKKNGKGPGHWNYTQSNVWNVDFTGFDRPGTYRLAVEGVGCSEDFMIQPHPRKTPFDVAVQGYYFMRIGQPKIKGIEPIPRQPLYIPGEDPRGTTVYLTSMNPFHPEWKSFAEGDVWDKEECWERYKLSGAPTNPNARGGHSDALDWDRHLAHVSNIYDILLPYLLSGGILDDDNTGIAESGNGIPDLIDTARYEVDFWLSLKTEHGYGHGLTNPTKEHVFYQAAPSALSAWVNAANAAMLADAFRLSGHAKLTQVYRDAAIEAWKVAEAADDPMLDEALELGYMKGRGRDFKMMAAAFLFNVTGSAECEDVIHVESVMRDSSDIDLSTRKHEQLYATVGYLMTPRETRYPELQENMRSAVIREARAKEAGETVKRPTRRAAYSPPCWFQTAQFCQRTLIAHAVASKEEDRALFRDALILEADWGLGRNPVNMIQMTTATTPLADKRSVALCYTSGQLDGVPGLHPGHTPYMNIRDWNHGSIMGRPQWMADQCYPAWEQWPHAEAHFNTRHVYANGEFTPRQTMRGKFAIYAYLYALEKRDSTD